MDFSLDVEPGGVPDETGKPASAGRGFVRMLVKDFIYTNIKNKNPYQNTLEYLALMDDFLGDRATRSKSQQ